MALDEQQTIFFTNLLNQWYQNKYGDSWKENFCKNMKPSPIKQWSEQYNVSVKDIQNLRMLLTFKYACGI